MRRRISRNDLSMDWQRQLPCPVQAIESHERLETRRGRGLEGRSLSVCRIGTRRRVTRSVNVHQLKVTDDTDHFATLQQRSEDELQHVGNWLYRPAWFEDSGVDLDDLEDREARLLHRLRAEMSGGGISDALSQREAIADRVKALNEFTSMRLSASQTVRNRLEDLEVDRGEIGRELALARRIKEQSARRRLEIQARRFAHDIESDCDFDALIRSRDALQDLRAGSRGTQGLATLATIEPKPIEWLWRGYIPKGKITDIVGDGDLGKSLVLLDIAARVTTGLPMPNEPHTTISEPRDVVLLIAEDDLADTVVPRLIAAGANRNRVHAFEDGISFPDDIRRIEEAIQFHNAALLVIDPVMSFLGDRVKSGIDSSVRNSIGNPLRDVASRTGCAVASLRHVNKDVNAATANRGGGSVAFRNMARAALAFGPDREDATESRRFMAQSKKNLGAQAKTLAYRIEPTFGRVDAEGVDGTPVVFWEGPADGVTAADLLGPPPKPDGPRAGTKGEKATRWLRDRLAGGTAVESKTILREMASEGFSKNVIGAAKKHAGVNVERISIGGAGNGSWLWSLE